MLLAKVQSLWAQVVRGVAVVIDNALWKMETRKVVIMFISFICLFSVCGLQEEKRGYFEGDQHGEELELVSEQHGVADDWHLGLQGVLDGHRRDVLATSGDDQLCANTDTGSTVCSCVYIHTFSLCEHTQLWEASGFFKLPHLKSTKICTTTSSKKMKKK